MAADLLVSYTYWIDQGEITLCWTNWLDNITNVPL